MTMQQAESAKRARRSASRHGRVSPAVPACPPTAPSSGPAGQPAPVRRTRQPGASGSSRRLVRPFRHQGSGRQRLKVGKVDDDVIDHSYIVAHGRLRLSSPAGKKKNPDAAARPGPPSIGLRSASNSEVLRQRPRAGEEAARTRQADTSGRGHDARDRAQGVTTTSRSSTEKGPSCSGGREGPAWAPRLARE